MVAGVPYTQSSGAMGGRGVGATTSLMRGAQVGETLRGVQQRRQNKKLTGEFEKLFGGGASKQQMLDWAKKHAGNPMALKAVNAVIQLETGMQGLEANELKMAQLRVKTAIDFIGSSSTYLLSLPFEQRQQAYNERVQAIYGREGMSGDLQEVQRQFGNDFSDEALKANLAMAGSAEEWFKVKEREHETGLATKKHDQRMEVERAITERGVASDERKTELEGTKQENRLEQIDAEFNKKKDLEKYKSDLKKEEAKIKEMKGDTEGQRKLVSQLAAIAYRNKEDDPEGWERMQKLVKEHMKLDVSAVIDESGAAGAKTQEQMERFDKNRNVFQNLFK